MERQDIYELLRKDHQAVMNLFNQILQSQGGAMGMTSGMGGGPMGGGPMGGPIEGGGSIEPVFNRLSKELLAHMESEETDFYAVLESEAQTRADIEQARREHNDLRSMLTQLRSVQIGSQQFMSMLQRAQQATQRHVQFEEGKLFNDSRQVIDESQAREIGRRWQQDKMRMMGQGGGPSMGTMR